MASMGFANLEAPWGALWPALFEMLSLEDREGPRPKRFKTEAARAAVDQVLAAENRADFIELLDEFIISDALSAEAGPRPAQPGGGLVQILERLKGKLDRLELDHESLDRTVGPSGTERCEEGLRAYRELIKLLLIVVHALSTGDPRTEPQAPAEPRLGVRDLLNAPRLPLGLRRHLLGIFRSFGSQAAIARAEERGDVAPWLSRALVDTYAAGPVHALASLRRLFTEGEVGSAVLADVKAGEDLAAAIERWKQEAKEHGDEPYFPFGAPHAEG